MHLLPGAWGRLGSRAGAPAGFPSRERPQGPRCPRGGSSPGRMRPPRPGCPNLLPNGSASFPLFLGEERRRAINRHGAGCLRRSGAVRTGLVKALVLTAGSRLPAPHPHSPQPGEGGAAGREDPPTPSCLSWAVSGPLPPSLTHAGVCEAAPALSAWLTSSLSPGPRGLHA